MCFFFLVMEELSHRRPDDCAGHIAAALPDTETVFIDVVYGNRPGTRTFEH